MKKGIGIGCLVLLLCFIGMYFVMNNKKLISKNTYLLSYFEYKDSTLKNNYYLDKKQTVGIIDGPIDVTHSEFDGVTINKKEFVSDSTEEDMRHGTSVAGLMIAQENNKGICGLLPNVNIVNAVVLQNSKAEQKKIAEAINYCVDEKVDVINISIELYRFDDILLQAIQYAEKNNVNIFMANGNGGWRKNIKNIERPDNKNLFFVGMLDRKGKISNSNMENRKADRYVIGTNLISTDISNGYGMFSGTSYSSVIACAQYVQNKGGEKNEKETY